MPVPSLMLPSDAPMVDAVDRKLREVSDVAYIGRAIVPGGKARFHVTINGVEYRITMRRSPRQLEKDR